jgi:dsRNA-specific ribonuclease
MNIYNFSINKIYNISTKQEPCPPLPSPSKKNLDLFKASITSKSKDKYCNYEQLELLGDKFIQFAMVKYCYEKLDMISVPNAENITTRIVAKYLATEYMYKMCLWVGVDKFIIYSPNEAISFGQICEDVLEAWIGACSLCFPVDKVYDFVFSMFDFVNIQIDYRSLYNSKTILNDLAACMNLRLHWQTSIEDEGVHVALTSERYPNLHVFSNGRAKNKTEENCATIFIEALQACKDSREYESCMNKIKSFQKWKEFQTGFERCKKRKLGE